MNNAMASATPVRERFFSVHEFHRMIEAGVFGSEENVELIAGRIVVMPPRGPLHASTVRRLHRMLLALGISVDAIFDEKPIQLADDSESEPDIAIVEPNPVDPEYRNAHPTAAFVRLVVEVSDSTVAFDLSTKASAYARAGIWEYWVVDLRRRCVLQHLQPQMDGYARIDTLSAGSGATLALPNGAQLAVDTLLAD